MRGSFGLVGSLGLLFLAAACSGADENSGTPGPQVGGTGGLLPATGGFGVGGSGTGAVGTGGAGTGGAGACLPGQVPCAGVCVFLTDNSANCGLCGNVCAPGNLCLAGTCVCQTGLLACNGACVDPQVDGTNCGACGLACAAGQSCLAGLCTCPAGSMACPTGCADVAADELNCGACGTTCAPGQECTGGSCQCQAGLTACAEGCVDPTSSATNCGACGATCAAPQVCSQGACQTACAPGELQCGQSCVDATADPLNCGACGAACAAGQSCTDGVCACPGGETDCGGTCVDTVTDAGNCGACGTVCGGGQGCVDGTCACSAGQLCGGQCVDTSVSALHCGACDAPCPGGTVCTDGLCGCAGGLSSCNGACTSYATDPANCGACGAPCAVGQACVDGDCIGGTGGAGGTGGVVTGGAPTGGAVTGGAPTGGVETGGAPTGGVVSGGASTGGIETGGTATGGSGGTVVCEDVPPPNGDTCAHAVEWGWCGASWMNGTCALSCGLCTGTGGTGGAATGGAPTGGVATGGVATGGVATGGVATGGVATGGAPTGGVATGGVATGGVATGGTATGGTATGGTGGTTCAEANPSGFYQLEDLDRGVVAVRTGSNNYVGWRMLGYEYDAATPSRIAYRLYRNDALVTTVTNSTNYMDNGAAANAAYSVAAVIDGVECARSAAATPWAQNYLSIPTTAPAGGTSPACGTDAGGAYTYTSADASAGDVDGDGTFELIVKWDPSNAKDNSQAGCTGNVYLDAYRLTGQRLWRIDLGTNIRAGAHYTQFVVYDFDGDGRSELAVKTAPGTRDGTGQYLRLGPAASDNDATAYRNSSGYVLTGPEYLTVFDGETGAELATVNFEVARGTVSAWGDSYGNRVDRFLATMGFVSGDGHPSIIMARGYYTRATLTAWDFDGSSLTRIKTWDSSQSTAYSGQGTHSLSIANVDADSPHEIIYGASTLDDNGTRKCSTNQGHGDSLHVTDLVPSRPGLEAFQPHESGSSLAYTMRDANTCAILWQGPNNGGVEGPGRGVAADITPANAGSEAWVNSAGLFSATSGSSVGGNASSCNFVIWWDGDLSRELLNGTSIRSYDTASSNVNLDASGCSANNGSKSTPSLSADLLGDWREEVVFRCGNTIRVYTTTAPSTDRIYTLMHDAQYREAISWQNGAYNQPPHPSFHIGSGMAVAPAPSMHLP